MGSGAGLADAAAVRRAGGGSPRAGHRPAAGGRAGAGRLRGRARRRGASAEPGHGRGGPALLDERTLVKTWAARGTLHLLPADQAAAHLVLCSAARYWEKGSWQRASGATPADVEAIAAAAADALSGGAALTREELTRTVLDRTGAEHLAELLGSGWGMLLKPLAWWGVLCYGPRRATGSRSPHLPDGCPAGRAFRRWRTPPAR
ncbi:winged helix DNA-binding domain-containing protein [Actinomadura madurae]|nr:crosslink repair DNA glycosylase YcaQ family protein [Actinomadura madurae]MCQ0014897.1 winged helix DNA-binding domain-containing protein [Actinomadura madurae]